MIWILKASLLILKKLQRNLCKFTSPKNPLDLLPRLEAKTYKRPFQSLPKVSRQSNLILNADGAQESSQSLVEDLPYSLLQYASSGLLECIAKKFDDSYGPQAK